MAERKRLERSILSTSYRPSAATEVGILEQQAVGQSRMGKLLDNMSSFFFEQMQEKVVEEAEQYGAANPITLEQLSNAQQSGEDVLKKYGYGTRGKVARSKALEGLILDVESEAARTFTALEINAKSTKIDPGEYAEQLDATILGFTNVTKDFPEISNKIKSTLSVSASGYLKEYYKDIAKLEVENKKRKYTAAFTTSLESLPQEIDSYIDNGGTIQDLFIKKKKTLSDAAFVSDISSPVFKKDLEVYRKDFVKTLFRAGGEEALRDEKASNDAIELLSRQKTNNNKINNIYNFLKPDEQQDFIKYLIKQDELQNKAVKDMADQKENENKLNEDIFTQAIANEEYSKAEEALSKLPLTKQNQLKSVLQKIGPEPHPSFLTMEQREIQSNLITKGENGSLTMEELVNNRENILYETFQSLVKQVNANIDTEFTKRSQLFVGKYKLDADLRDLSDQERKDRQIALEIKADVFEKYIEAKAKNKTFDIKAEFETQEQNLIVKINKEVDNKLLKNKDKKINDASYMRFGGEDLQAKQLLTLEQAIQFLTYLSENREEAGKKYKKVFFQPPATVQTLLEELKRIKELESQ